MAVPTPPNIPWTSGSSPRHSIHPIPLAVFEALEAGDLERASSLAPASLPPLPPFLISEANRDLWRRRLDLVAADLDQIPWISRVVVYKPDPDSQTERPCPEVIVGKIGFHGKPDVRGVVEIGYEIDPTQRRRGHAAAAMRIMVDIARAIEGVNVLKASVVEENWISRRIVENLGLRKVGCEVHERRGLEDVFEMDVTK
jgi:ribosomal-protein-alanine N-acetyltransferase